MTEKFLECPVFRPTLDDVRNLSFVQYVQKVEPEWLHMGMCRIVAPDGWTPRRAGYEDLAELTLPRPIRQHATGRQGLYRTLLVEQKSQTLSAFKAMSEEAANAAPAGEPETLERKFWKNVPMNPPLYGADIPGTLFDDRSRGWNLKRLNSILSTTIENSGASIPGVTQPYLYVGSWRSFFAWHTEDLDLHSVNYLHTGAPKTWYVVPPAARERFELTATDLLPELSRSCPEFLRHKEIILSPALLAAHNIPLVKAVHRAREFVVVGPGAYHAGFNHGFNIAESVNFATPAWVPVGAHASFCTCRPDSVKIDMRLFADYMDPALAREVMDSYRSDSERESSEADEEEGGSSESEEEEEDSSESSESESENESSEEEEEDEELPAKRIRRPSAKAAASLQTLNPKPAASMRMCSGLRHAQHVTTSSPVAARKPVSVPASALRRLNQEHQNGGIKGYTSNPTKKASLPLVRSGGARRGSPLLQKEQFQKRRALARRNGGKQQHRVSVMSTSRINKKGRGAVPAAAAAAAVLASSSSDDDSAGGAGTRGGSKRGAARAWYRLFDSLLPSLKRARA